jgi:hypothetical protein
VKMNFLDRLLKNPPISNFVEILPAGAEFFHADGRKVEYNKYGKKILPIKKQIGKNILLKFLYSLG